MHDATLGVLIFDALPAQQKLGLTLLLNTIHNWTITILLPLLYIWVYVELRRKMSNSQNQEQLKSKVSRAGTVWTTSPGGAEGAFEA